MANNPDFTHEFVRQCLDYDPATGLMVWKCRPDHHFTQGRAAAWNTKNAGRPAFITKSIFGYLEGRLCGRRLKAHRVAWFWVHGKWPETIDHINWDKADNRISNLRDVSMAENSRNQPHRNLSNTGIQGVSKIRGSQKWSATFYENGKQTVRSFHSLEEAVAFREAALKRLGFHPNHGR